MNGAALDLYTITRAAFVDRPHARIRAGLSDTRDGIEVEVRELLDRAPWPRPDDELDGWIGEDGWIHTPRWWRGIVFVSGYDIVRGGSAPAGSAWSMGAMHRAIIERRARILRGMLDRSERGRP